MSVSSFFQNEKYYRERLDSAPDPLAPLGYLE